jgi:hypothetical protein
MDATVAEQDIEAVPWGVEAPLTGLVVYRVNLQGKIQPEFRIDSVAASGAARLRPRAEAIRRPKRELSPPSSWTAPGRRHYGRHVGRHRRHPGPAERLDASLASANFSVPV